MTRSSTNSGTASPAVHSPHSSIPLSPAHSNSSSHPAPHAHVPTSHSAPSHAHHPHHLHHMYGHGHSHLHASHQPMMPGGEGTHGFDDSNPHIPDAVAAAGPTPPVSGAVTPNGRAHFVETLQSKKWGDALVHGSWV